MALPSNVGFGTVTGAFLRAVADSPADSDRDPEGLPVTDLQITFTASLSPKIVRDTGAVPPVLIVIEDVLATVGSDGILVGPDGQPGVRLVSSTDPDLQPSNWTWTVTFKSATFPAISFSFTLDAGATVDLAAVVQVPSSPGATLDAWLKAVADATAARDAAIAAAASVPSAASLAATQVPVLGVLAVATTAVAPTPGKIQPYNAAGGALAPALPALSSMTVGGTSRLGVQKAVADTSGNTVTITAAGSDTFDSGSTTIVLRGAGELRDLEAVSVGGTKYWKIVGGNTPLSYFDGTYPALNSSARLAIGGTQLDPSTIGGVAGVSGVLSYLGKHATVAALKGARPLDGTLVTTAGYTTAGDGGSATYRFDASSTAVDDGGSVLLPTTGSGAGRWILATGGRVSVKWFGAKGDGTTDDTTSIQNAINYVLYSTGVARQVYIPYGVYKTTNTIQVGYGENYRTLTIEGDTAFGSDQVTMLATILPSFNDRPTINIQGARNVKFRNLALRGVNMAWLYQNQTFTNSDRTVVSNWYGPNISAANNTQWAPYAGITIDAYAGPRPATSYPDVAYPSFTGISSQWNKNWSSGITFENVSISGFVVGLCVQPAQVGDASNGDFITLRDCDLSFNVVAYADGHADSRNVNWQNVRAHFCHTVADSLTYGNQHGSLALNADGCSFDNVFRILNIGIGGYTIQGGFPVRFVGCYGEALYSLGSAYAATGSLTTGVAFQECKFTFVYRGNEYSPTYLYSAPGTDLYLRNTALNSGYGFHHFNCNLIGDTVLQDKLLANVFPSNTTADKVANSYTCGYWATSVTRFRTMPFRFFTFYGYSKYGPGITYDSEAFPINIDSDAAAGTGSGTPIPFFVNFLSYGRSKFSASNVAPLTFDRATYNLTAVSISGNQRTFTVSQTLISDALGAAALTSGYQSYSVGKGDIIVDNATGLVFHIISVTFNGTTDMTLVVRQLNGVRTADNGSTWTATGTLATSAGTMTLHNARRVYPSNARRVNLTATSGSGAVSLKNNGDEATATDNFRPAGNGDYLISSNKSQTAAESVFPQTKITASNQSNGSFTLDQNARRAFYGDCPLFVRGTL